MGNSKDILAKLVELNQDELKEARVRINALLDEGSDSTAEEFYGCLRHVMADDGLALPPLKILRKGPLGSSFRTGVEVIQTFVANKFRPGTKMQRLRANRVCCEAVMIWMREMTGTLTTTMLIRNLQNAPVAVDKQFPGYSSAGLLPLVLDTRLFSE